MTCLFPYKRLLFFIFLLVFLNLGGMQGLAQETDQEVPVASVGGEVRADLFTGTATTSIPIDVPPGRGGVHPDLALVYGSANGNGWLGMGWKLEKGVIERQTKFGVDYSGDAYVFRLSGINVELVNIGDDEYRAKVEGGFTRVQKLTASDGRPYFMATDKTGKKFYFGQEANTRAAKPDDADQIFRWCLDRVEDPHGNYMTLSYTQDQGQTYQARIDYTGHGSLAPSNSVIFHLEDRPDAPPMYVPNFLMKTAKRLKTIEVRANDSLVRAYALNYVNTGGTNRSLLSIIQQFGKDALVDGTGAVVEGTGLPPISLTNKLITDDGTFASTIATVHSATSYGSIWKTWQLADVNGDGLADMVASRLGTNQGWRSSVALVNGTPLLLETIANGLGGSTTIEYTPSTQYANTQLPYPVQTVSAITTDDGNSHVATSTYTYEGGFHHLGERDFRGFAHVTVTGPAGPSGEQTLTETWFHQGNDTEVDVNTPNVPNGYLKGAPYRTQVTDAQGNLYTQTLTTYTADDDGAAPFFSPPASVVTDICDGNGCSRQTRTDYTYDVYGNVIEEYQYGDVSESADDRTVVRTFAPNTTDWILGLPTQETLSQGLGTGGSQLAQSDFYYDGTTSCTVASTNQLPTKGQLTRVVNWLNGGSSPETRMAYDGMGNVVCTRDALGHTTTMTYGSSGTFATAVTNPLGHRTTTQYYGVNDVPMDTGLYGQVKQVTDPNGAVVTSKYDALGRRTRVTQPDGFWTTTSYVAFGTVGSQHVRSDSPLGLSIWTYFDGLGRTMTTKSTGTDSKIIVSNTDYDVRGAVTRSSTPYFETGGTPLWSTNTYDPMGRVVQTTNPDGSRGLTCHDDGVSVSLDANDHRKRVTRDAYGRVQTVQEYTGTYTTCNTAVSTPYSTTTYQYDGLGNLVTLTDTQGNVSTMTYDTLSRKIAMHDPDMGDWTYVYDVNGNLTLQTDAKGQTIHFHYDVLNRRIQKDYSTVKAIGAGDVVYTYDGNTNHRIGRLAQVQDASGTTTFFYDVTGRVIQTDKHVTNQAGGESTTYTIQSTYDGLGRVTALTYPDTSTVTQTYNGPQLQGVQEGSTTYATYGGFNALGQPSTLTYGNGVTTSYIYNPQTFRLTTLKTVNGSTVLQDLGYIFDAGGNVTQLTDGLTTSGHSTQTFNYDDLDRLTLATGAYGNLTYTYDAIGNLLSNSRVGTYTYPPSGHASVRPHAVTQAGSETYTYDANGNLISGARRTMAYDAENRPVQITASGGSPSGWATVGEVSVRHTWQPVALPVGTMAPVVIAAPPTFQGPDPGVVRVRQVTPTGFELRFAEWTYENGVHNSPETVAYLALEPGRYALNGGDAAARSRDVCGEWEHRLAPAGVYSGFSRYPARLLDPANRERNRSRDGAGSGSNNHGVSGGFV